MVLDLDLLEVVAIGSFNPAIITPDWLHEVGVCQPDDAVAEGYTDWADEATFVAGGLAWEVDYGRLAVSTNKPRGDCGEVVAKVLRELPHTPVEAVGHNFHFTCPRAEWTGVEPLLGQVPLSALANLGADEVRWDGRFRKPHAWVEVTLRIPASDADFVAVRFNHHHTVDGASVKERNAAAIKAAARFTEDQEATESLLKSLFAIG